MWEPRKMHEISGKGRVFFLKNMVFSFKMEDLLKIKNIRDKKNI
jgi:hypothetical protein